MIAEYLEAMQNQAASDTWVYRSALHTGITVYDSAFSADCLKNLTPLQPEEIEIFLCTHGRMEIQLAEHRMQFVGPGDLVILAQTSQVPAFFFPLGQFQCKVLRIEGKIIEQDFQKSIENLLAWPDSRKMLQNLLEKHHGCVVFRDELWSSSLQLTLAQLPPENQNRYWLLAVLERLYFLCQKKTTSEKTTCPERYYDQYQREAVRAVHDYMLAHMEESLTIQSLARRFQMSPTFLKSCFRQLYGQPIHTYLQQHRLQQAAYLLSTTKDSVVQIAAAVGYNGTSRFGVAFKERYQMTPAQYRRLHETRMSKTEQILSKKEGKNKNVVLKYKETMG